ncbi:glycosyltransferase family 2 protein [Sphaerotilus sp.]|uniref:glycosyltransferase family 2 protein n=1 Tax=Sphaerotilus sp. TaxID=2093942 RepID=UPI00286D96F2|nr:glycosyltransferase family 2 protein [Sphaerotilus sp.]
MPRYTVAAVLIVRDEAPRLRRALDSLRPWTDRLVVLDTGSQDDTVAIARAAGAEVSHLRWCDDFSLARNAALERAGADWHIVVDGDEWLARGGETLATLRTLRPDFVGAVRVDSDHGPHDSASVASSWISRLLPGPVRYAGRIHEQPQHALPVRRLPLCVGHDGYGEAALGRKAGRNATLLQRSLDEQPADAYLWYQLGKDHDVYGRHTEALRCFDQAEALLGTPAAGSAPAWLHDLSVRSLHALKCCGRHADGVQRASDSMERWDRSPDFFFALGDLMLDWAASEPVRANELLPMIEGAWQRCLEIGERPDLEGAVHGRGSHLAQHNLGVLRQFDPVSK